MKLLSQMFVTCGIITQVKSSRPIGWLPMVGEVVIPHDPVTGLPRPGLPNCTLMYFEQTIDHFSWRPTPTGAETFKQRVFFNHDHWREGGPILFYTGNEANVELYVNATGWMWENAEALGAALVWAEHRYYGESMPFTGTQSDNMKGDKIHYLTSEQALADYAVVIAKLKAAWGAQSSAVIALGGSYGGMLAAWLRMKYPGSVDGAIAASAPILGFVPTPGRPQPSPVFGDGEKFWQIVTEDASSKGGSAPECANNVRLAWKRLFALGESDSGRKALATAFHLCEPLTSRADIYKLAMMHLNAFDTMAMGNFPYASNYLVFQQTQNPSLELPAFPVRAACEFMRGPFPEGDEGDVELLAALCGATAVLYNVSGAVPCFSLPEDTNNDGIWDYQYCTEMLPQETHVVPPNVYFSRDGVKDMFWDEPMNMTAIDDHCTEAFGVRPRREWIGIELPGAVGASNIVFSNGEYDPWRSGGVRTNLSDSVVALTIRGGAHHLDLMFSNSDDNLTDVQQARKAELELVRRWIAET